MERRKYIDNLTHSFCITHVIHHYYDPSAELRERRVNANVILSVTDSEVSGKHPIECCVLRTCTYAETVVYSHVCGPMNGCSALGIGHP